MKTQIQLTVNGKKYNLEVENDTTLLKLLRNELGMTGTKEGCGAGECGACTVIMDGKAVDSCITLAVQANGKDITTIEGLADGKQLHPIQNAFINAGAIQCGFCTPGMVLSTKALLDHNPSPSEEEIREALAGNLCRCTGYVKIVEAVKIAAEKMRGDS